MIKNNPRLVEVNYNNFPKTSKKVWVAIKFLIDYWLYTKEEIPNKIEELAYQNPQIKEEKWEEVKIQLTVKKLEECYKPHIDWVFKHFEGVEISDKECKLALYFLSKLKDIKIKDLLWKKYLWGKIDIDHNLWQKDEDLVLDFVNKNIKNKKINKELEKLVKDSNESILRHYIFNFKGNHGYRKEITFNKEAWSKELNDLQNIDDIFWIENSFIEYVKKNKVRKRKTPYKDITRDNTIKFIYYPFLIKKFEDKIKISKKPEEIKGIKKIILDIEGELNKIKDKSKTLSKPER